MFSSDHNTGTSGTNTTEVMTGNAITAVGADYGVRSAVNGAGGYPLRSAQVYRGDCGSSGGGAALGQVGMDASTAYYGGTTATTSTGVDGMKGFECSDLDHTLLGSGGINAGSTAERQMYVAASNRTGMNANSGNVASYGEYGQTGQSGQSLANADGIGYGQMAKSPLYNNNNNQHMTNYAYGRYSHQHFINSTDTPSVGVTRKQSASSVQNNMPAQSYTRSNSYPLSTPYENSHNQFLSSSSSNSQTGLDYNQTYQDFDISTSSSSSTGQMCRKSQTNNYQQPPYALNSVKRMPYNKSAMDGQNWSDSGYSVASKYPLPTNGLHLGDRNASMYPHYQHGGTANSTAMQGLQYTNSRDYASSNNNMSTNHYPVPVTNADMCTPASTSVNLSNTKFAKSLTGVSQQRQSLSHNKVATGHSTRMSGYNNVNNVQASLMGPMSFPGRTQPLRHYGPMPNQAQHFSYHNYNTANGASFSRSATSGINTQEQCSNYDQYSGATASMRQEKPRGLDGRFAPANQTVQAQGMPTHYPMQTQKPYHSIAQQTGVPYSNKAKPEAFNPNSMQTTTTMGGSGCQDVYNQTLVDGQSQQFNTMNDNSGIMSHNNTSSVYQVNSEVAQSEADIRRNMIFSAELEKLARLSRDPMSDTFSGEVGVMEVNTEEGNAGLTQPIQNPPFQNTSSGDVMQDQFSNVQLPNSAENNTIGKNYTTPAATAPATSTIHVAKKSSALSSVTDTGTLSTPSTPSSNTGGLQQQASPDPNPTRPAVHSSAPLKPGTPTLTTVQSSQEKGKDTQNAVLQLQRLTQSLKEKKEDGTKTSHMEYLSHGSDSSSSIGGQNCIAALSAACRNMIADMDNSVQKLNSASLTVLDNVGSSLGQKYMSTTHHAPTSFGTQMSEQMFSPPITNGQNMSPPLVSICENYSSPSYSTVSAPPDYQTQFTDFVEQSVPMQMNTRRPEEKPRKKGKRKKSDDVNEVNPASTIGPKKRRGRKKSPQNPLSVESLDQLPSLDNLGEFPLIEGNCCRPSPHTSNMMTNSWRNCDPKLLSPDQVPVCMLSSRQPPSVDSDCMTQDFLDSVFSPDTTMPGANQDPVDPFGQLTSASQSHHSPASSLTSQQSMNETASTGSYSSQGGLMSRTNHNYQTDSNTDQTKLVLSSNHSMRSAKTPNSAVSSTGDSVSNPVSTSSDVTDINSDKSTAEEIHPLEILQAQIQLQRQQFNLNDSRPLPLKNASKKTVAANQTKKVKPASASQGEVDVNVLMAEEDSTWYFPNEHPKEPEVPWENMRKSVKGQQVVDVSQPDRRTQNKLLEQKRRDTLKNSIDSLKNALPDGRNMTDQTQQNVLITTQNYIKEMLEKQHRNKTCLDEIETLKTRNHALEEGIALLKQEYDILSNFE